MGLNLRIRRTFVWRVFMQLFEHVLDVCRYDVPCLNKYYQKYREDTADDLRYVCLLTGADWVVK